MKSLKLSNTTFATKRQNNIVFIIVSILIYEISHTLFLMELLSIKNTRMVWGTAIVKTSLLYVISSLGQILCRKAGATRSQSGRDAGRWRNGRGSGLGLAPR